MNKIFSLFVGIVCLNLATTAQSDWFEQTVPVSTDLYDIEFINLNVGFAVGDEGRILKTTNGGYTWLEQSSGTSVTLFDCQFYDELTGWVCGAGGTFLRTTNGGATWESTIILANDEFHAIHFFNATSGYVGGKNISTGYAELYYTVNGGLTFFGISPPPSLTNIKDLIFVNLNAGYVLDDYGLHYTTNGGSVWSVITVPTTFQMNSVESLDVTNNWLVGNNGSIFYSPSSGTSWFAQTSGTTENLYGISAIDANTVFVCGANGTILLSTDGGGSWTAQNTPTSNTLKSVSAVTLNSAWSCGVGPKIVRSDAYSDLEILSYQGVTEACKNAPFAVLVEVKNAGEYTIGSGTFTVLENSTQVLTYNLTTPIPSGQTVLLDLGEISIIGNSALTIYYNGDDQADNNSVVQFIDLIIDAEFGTNGPLTACAGENVELSAYGGNQYLWLNASTDSTAQTQHISVFEDANYIVKIEQTNCIVYDTVVVTVINGNCGNAAFSPNNDGVNDYFHISGLPVGNNTVTIYNRWGDIIASFQNYNNSDVVWHGDQSDNDAVVEGTYFFTVESQNGEAVLKGWVQVVR